MIASYGTAHAIAHTQDDKVIEILAQTIAFEEHCSLAYNQDTALEQTMLYFEGKEEKLLSSLEAQVSLASYSMKNAKPFEKKILCKAAQAFITRSGWNK